MGPQAEVEPVALAVDRNHRIVGQGGDVLGLVLFADLVEVADRRFPVPDLAGDRLVALDDLAHAIFDDLQVVGREGFVAGEVVVEAVFDGRAEGHLRAGVKLLHRLGQYVGAVVAQQLQRVGMAAGDDFDVGVGVDGGGEILQVTVHLDRQGRLGKAGPDIGGDLQPGNRAVESAPTAVRQGYGHHVNCIPPLILGSVGEIGSPTPGNLEGILCLSSDCAGVARQSGLCAARNSDTLPPRHRQKDGTSMQQRRYGKFSGAQAVLASLLPFAGRLRRAGPRTRLRHPNAL